MSKEEDKKQGRGIRDQQLDKVIRGKGKGDESMASVCRGVPSTVYGTDDLKTESDV